MNPSRIVMLLGCLTSLACAPIVSAGSDQITRELSAPSLSCGRAPNYQRTQVMAANHCLWWPEQNRGLTYTIDSLASQRTNATAEAQSISAAFHTWNSVSAGCSDLSFSPSPTTAPATVSVDDSMFVMFPEGRCSEVVPATDTCWADERCDNIYHCWDHAPNAVGITTVTYSTSTGKVVDADIELNAADFVFTTVDGPACPEDAPAPNCIGGGFAGCTHP